MAVISFVTIIILLTLTHCGQSLKYVTFHKYTAHKFMSTTYKFVTKPKVNWTQAVDACASHRLILATARTLKESNYLYDLVKTNGDKHHEKHFWVGGKLKDPGYFIWSPIKGTPKIDDYFWAEGQPSSLSGDLCVDLWSHESANRTAGNVQECSKIFNFVCSNEKSGYRRKKKKTTKKQQILTTPIVPQPINTTGSYLETTTQKILRENITTLKKQEIWENITSQKTTTQKAQETTSKYFTGSVTNKSEGTGSESKPVQPIQDTTNQATANQNTTIVQKQPIVNQTLATRIGELEVTNETMAQQNTTAEQQIKETANQNVTTQNNTTATTVNFRETTTQTTASQNSTTQNPQQLITENPQQLTTQNPQQLTTQNPQQLTTQTPEQLATQNAQQLTIQYLPTQKPPETTKQTVSSHNTNLQLTKEATMETTTGQEDETTLPQYTRRGQFGRFIVWADQNTTQTIQETTIQSTQKITTEKTTSKLTTQPTPIDFDCSSKNCGRYSDPKNCKGYFICQGNTTLHDHCPSDLFFSNETGTCDLPERADCGDCQNKRGNWTKSKIYPFGRLHKINFIVHLITDQDGGSPWTLIQRRCGPQENFSKTWTQYEDGFGNIDQNYWIGLKILHKLTQKLAHEIRFDLYDWEGNHAVAKYSQISIGNSSEFYKLKIGGYSGNAGNSMIACDGAKFSTLDIDNDLWSGNCAAMGGAWWHNYCSYVTLNGQYLTSNLQPNKNSVHWKDFNGDDFSLKNVEIKIRKVNF